MRKQQPTATTNLCDKCDEKPLFRAITAWLAWLAASLRSRLDRADRRRGRWTATARTFSWSSTVCMRCLPVCLPSDSARVRFRRGITTQCGPFLRCRRKYSTRSVFLSWQSKRKNQLSGATFAGSFGDPFRSRMGPRVPLEDRKLIVSLSHEGISQREICRRTGRSMSAVNRIIQAYKRDNGRLVDADRPGRPRSTDDTKDTLIAAAVVADPSLSAGDVQKSLSLKVSCATICRRLRDAGFCNQAAVPRPHLTDRERQQRLDFARDVERWTPEEWREVIFTGESSFCARWDQQRRAWGPVNRRYADGQFARKPVGE